MTETKTLVIEKLAELEHEQWSQWIDYMIRFGEIHGGMMAKEYWRKKDELARTPYDKLTEKQKEKDREWARKVYAILEADVLRERMELKQKIIDKSRKLNYSDFKCPKCDTRNPRIITWNILPNETEHKLGFFCEYCGFFEPLDWLGTDLVSVKEVLPVLDADKPRCHFDNIHVYKKETNK